MTKSSNERMTDLKRLRAWVDDGGPERVARLVETGISLHMINEMLKGRYKKAPRGGTRKLLCDATGLAENELFPLATSGVKKKAG